MFRRHPSDCVRFILHYGVGVVATGLVLCIRLLLRPVLGNDAPFILFVVAVVAAAGYGGVGPGLLSTALATMAGLYFFGEPLYTLAPGTPRETEDVILFVVSGLLLTMLGEALRSARRRAETAQNAVSAAYARERRITEALQESLLRMPASDALPGLMTKTLYRAARDEARVGGDLMDLLALPDGRFAVVIGDVVGKGLAAAARTAEIKASVRAYLYEHASPGEALVRLNDLMASMPMAPLAGGDTLLDATYAAMIIVVLDLQRETLSLAVAGAEPPLLSSAGEAAPLAVENGPMVGMFGGQSYAESHFPLRPHDLLILFTDGITEARQGTSFFGSEGIAAVVSRRAIAEGDATDPSDGLAALGGAILAEAEAFGGGRFEDDVCLMLLEVRGTA